MINRWRRKRYWCRHSKVEADEKRVCGLDLCSLPVLIDCCETCTKYEGKDRGLGDTIKRFTDAVGVKTCGKCQERREALNKATRKLYRSDNNGLDQ